MYTLIKSFGRRKDNPRLWKEVDTSTIKLSQIFIDYKQFYLLIEDRYMEEPELFDLMSLKNDYFDSNMTIDDFLLINGNNRLTTVPNTLNSEIQYVKYADAIRAGFKIDIVSQLEGFGADSSIDDKTWLILRKEGLDYSLFEKHCLTFVNGFLHFSEVNNQGVYIKEGDKSRRVSGHNTVGILSFKDVSELKQIPITDTMVNKQGDNDLSFRTVIDVGEDISDKTILMSIGGYLITPSSNIFSLESKDKLIINFNRYDILNRFFESREFIDFSSFGLDTPDTNDEQYINNELHSDQFITALLTSPQSFIVLLDNPDISFTYTAVRPSLMPGIYTSLHEPIYPLIVGNGMLGNYWYTYQRPYWSLNTLVGLYHKRQYNTTKVSDVLSMDDSRVPGDPVKWSKANYLMISTGYIERLN